MALIAFTGAPQGGATTLALATFFAWPRSVLLVDADLDVGPIRGGLLQTHGAQQGLPQAAAAARQGILEQELPKQCVQLSNDGITRLLLPGVTDPGQGNGLEYSWDAIAAALSSLANSHMDVLVDLGRSGTSGRQSALARAADSTLFVVESTLANLVSARARLQRAAADLTVAGVTAPLGLVVVDGPRAAANRYPAEQIARELHTELLSTIPEDTRTAAWLRTGGNPPRGAAGSVLLRAGRSLSTALTQRANERKALIGLPASGPVGSHV